MEQSVETERPLPSPDPARRPEPSPKLHLALRAAVACAESGRRLLPPETRFLFLQVAAFAQARRDEGAEPEAVIVELKRLLDGCSTSAHVLDSVEQLRGRVVRWAIEAYYVAGTPELPHD